MENLRVWSFLFWALLSTSFAQEIPTYFKVGGQLQLDPEFKGPALTNIVWKLNGDLVAERIQSMDIQEYYARFKGRTTLDIKTGRLTMNNLTDADKGTFSVELNHRVQPQRYIAKAILEVPEPDVVVQPLACQIISHTVCTLRCNGDTTGAGPVTYSWREGDGEWQAGGQDKTITKTETKQIEEYSCQIMNPVSNKASTSQKNPFYVEGSKEEQGSSNGGVVAGVSVGVILLVLAVAGFFGWKNQDKIRQRLFPNESSGITANGNKTPSSGETAAPKPEEVPLNDPPTPGANA